MLNFKYYQVHMILITEILGGVSKNQDLYIYHAQTKARTEAEKAGQELTEDQMDQEMKTIQEQFLKEKGWTGFHWFNGVPILYDYVIRGFAKEAIQGARRNSGSLCSKISAYKKEVDQGLFVYPRFIPLMHPDMPQTPEHLYALGRALRGQTAQGERITLVQSDIMPPGTKLTVELWVTSKKLTKDVLEEIFCECGLFKGLGQWRSGGWGRFIGEITEIEKPTQDPLNLPRLTPDFSLDRPKDEPKVIEAPK